MFNDKYGLTEAVLSGRKTQTRRIAYEFGYRVDKCKIWGNNITYMDGKMQVLDEFPNPRYKVGEVVAIAQNYADVSLDNFESFIKADYTKMKAGWKNKMFVRADLMPHHIRITDVKIERLQDISDEDCIREGIICKWHSPACRNYYYVPNEIINHPDKVHETPQEAFAAMIDRVSGKGTWDSNPWVFAYEFELVD